MLAEKQVAKRWFVMQDMDLLARKDLSFSDKTVYSYLRFRQGQNKYSNRSISTMTKELGCTKGVLLRTLKRLQDKGLIMVVKGGRSVSNRYAITDLDSSFVDIPHKTKVVSNDSAEVVSKRDRKSNYSKKNSKHIQAISCLEVGNDTKELVREHLYRSSVELSKDKIANLERKAEWLLRTTQKQYGGRAGAYEHWSYIVEKWSHKSTKGDGWGIVLKAGELSRQDQRKKGLLSTEHKVHTVNTPKCNDKDSLYAEMKEKELEMKNSGSPQDDIDNMKKSYLKQIILIKS